MEKERRWVGSEGEMHAASMDDKEPLDSCKCPWVGYSDLDTRVTDLRSLKVNPTSRLPRPGRPYSSSFSEHSSEIASPPSASKFKHANWNHHPNSPEIKVKIKPEVPSTSSQHLSCPQQSHGRNALTHSPTRQGQQIPQHHSIETWQIHNQAQVCLTPLPMCLCVQKPETSLWGEWTSAHLGWLWVNNTHSWNYSAFYSLTSISFTFPQSFLI